MSWHAGVVFTFGQSSRLGWQRPAWPDELAFVTAWMVIQVVLMQGLGRPKGAGGKNRRHDGAGPHAGGVHRGNRLYGNALLMVCRVEDGRPVAESAVVTLAVRRCRVMDLEKELQKAPIPWLFRIKIDLDGLRVRSNRSISRIGRIAPTISRPRLEDIRVSTE